MPCDRSSHTAFIRSDYISFFLTLILMFIKNCTICIDSTIYFDLVDPVIVDFDPSTYTKYRCSKCMLFSMNSMQFNPMSYIIMMIEIYTRVDSRYCYVILLSRHLRGHIHVSFVPYFYFLTALTSTTSFLSLLRTSCSIFIYEWVHVDHSILWLWLASMSCLMN